MAEQPTHRLALVIDAQLPFLLSADSATAALAFPQLLVIVGRQTVTVLEMGLVVASAYLVSVFGIGFPPFPPGLVYFLLVRFPVTCVGGELLLSIDRVLRVSFL